jgi:antirestriction protein ArdC
VNVYEIVTNQILDAMTSGVCPWRKPWQSGEAGLPMNAVSKKEYRGINLWLLGMSRFADNRWFSFKQAQQLGGNIRRGEKASTAVFWKMLDTITDANGEKRKDQVPMLRYYSVFNVEQCEGLKLPPLSVPTVTDHQRIEAAEALTQAMPNRPTITEGGNGAWYMPSADRVNVPCLSSFESADAYYATLFHELGHSTGHESRLDRKEVQGIVRFGSADYSREELTAELTSAFCCASLKLDNSLIDNSAAYLQGWLRALKDDPKMIVIAAARAQKAADYIRGLTEESGE